LRYFVAAAETENLTRAAERLNVVQSAISHQVRGLEEELGVELFTRHGRRVQLSPAGSLLLEEARAILKNVGRAKARVVRVGAGLVGDLHIGFQTVACRNQLVSKSLFAFRAGHPEVDLKLSPAPGVKLLQYIRNGVVDAGFLHLQGENPELSSIKIQTTNWLLALPKGHHLEKMRSLKLKDLNGESFIWIPRAAAPSIHDGMMKECLSGGLNPHIAQEVFGESMIISLVSIGLGVSFVIDTTPDIWPRSMISYKKVSDFSMPLDMSLAWRNDNRSIPLERLVTLVDTLSKKL
jgi:DNA-binding transcriptional LysR family regulator